MSDIRPADSSRFHMADIGAKTPTRRRAVAQGRITVGPEALKLILEKRLAKGDVLALAETAGILAAKNASTIIPLCHPLSLEHVEVRCHPEPARAAIRVECEAALFGKTGVEMEALAGVSAALLTIHDLVKPVNPACVMGDIRLDLKEGGKSGVWKHPASSDAAFTAEAPVIAPRPWEGLRVSVLTISDRVSRGEAEDVSGAELARLARELGAEIATRSGISDELEWIAKAVTRFVEEEKADVVLCTGGTGFGPRDVTPEALDRCCERLLPGIGEALRAEGARRTRKAWLSRSTAGACGRSLVVALPGSPKAVREGMEVLAELVPHALHVLRGGGH